MSEFLYVLPIVGTACYLIGCIVSIMGMNGIWRRDAVKRGFAEHDPQTGEWKWKESKP